MPPRIGRTEAQRQTEVARNDKPIEKQPAPERKVDRRDNGTATRLGDLRLQGQQQRSRLEHLIPAGIGGISAINDTRLRNVSIKADKAYEQTYKKEIAALENYNAKQKSGVDTSDYKGPKNIVEVSRRAEDDYRAKLKEAGFAPSDVPGASAVKAADFLRAEAKRSGGITSLSAEQVRARVGEKPQYIVRLLDKNHLTAHDSRLARYDDNVKKVNAWVATPDELAGAKLDVPEVMRRIGYSEDYVKSTADALASGKKMPSDFVLSVMETTGTKGATVATWDKLFETAKKSEGFDDFKTRDTTFWDTVKTVDYQDHINKKGKTDLQDYLSTLPKREQGRVEARFLLEDRLGANPLYTGDGTTMRPDTQNNRVGAREWFVDNLPIKNQQRTTFVELRDLTLGDNPTVKSQSKISTIAENPLRLRGEMRSGAVAGGAFSAAMSLREVYDRTQRGDYTGAAQTFAVNTGAGAAIGGVSAAGERIVGRGIETALTRSNLVGGGLGKLYASGAARNVVGRLAQTEASTLTSQTFSTTLRTVGGRIGGAGVIGGLVSGGFSAYDQIGAYRRGEVRGAQAFGTVVGETAVGVGAGAAGAAAGAAIGVWFGGVGAVPGAIIGFGVGFAADKVMRMGGVDKAIAKGVTSAIDAGSRVAGTVQRASSQAAGTVQRHAVQAVRAGREFVGRQVTQARAVYHSASSAVKSARAFVGQKLDNARQRVSSAARAAVNYVSQVKDRAVSAVRNTASQAVNQVRSTVSSVTSRVSSTVNSIANQASSAVSSAAASVANSAVSNLKSVFGW